MDAVLGTGPLALALVEALNRSGQAALGSPEPMAGPLLWRRADPDSGEGVRALVSAAKRLWLVLDEPTPAHGAFVVARKLEVAGAVIWPLGQPPPPGLAQRPDWAGLQVGPCWGPQEPLVARWSELVARGAHLWVPDPGVLHPVSMPDAVAAALAVMDHPQARWRLPGQPARLPELAEALGRLHHRPVRASRMPLRWSMRRIGLDPERIRRWLAMPGGEPHTPGWSPPPGAGREGWTGPARSPATEEHRPLA